MDFHHRITTPCVLVLAFIGASCTSVESTRSTGGHDGAYFDGTYPNLFRTLLGKEDSLTRIKIDTAFDQLFFGDDSSERVYYPVEPDMGYVKDIFSDDVRSEGMSYGMMIAVQMDRQDVFDRIWKWVKTYMQMQRGAHKGYCAWHCRADGSVIDSGAASDGEEWFVTSLFFASARWGGTYRNEAQDMLNTMLHKDDEGPRATEIRVSESAVAHITPMFNKNNRIVTFVPSSTANSFSDPSYVLPHYYELWARWADRDKSFWCEAADSGREMLKRSVNPLTGLAPDYAGYDGTPVTVPWGGGHDAFRYDAWRVGMNVAMDFTWFGDNPWAVKQSNRLLTFFHSQGIYGNQYTLDGKKLGDSHSTGLVAANAVAALASTLEIRKSFVEEFWNTPVPSGHYRYYDGMLYMLGLLQVSGNFRIYDPTGVSVQSCY